MPYMKSFFSPLMIPFLSMTIIFSYNVLNPTTSLIYGSGTNDSASYQSPNGESIAKWWTWWMGIPNNAHPVNNYTDPERCSTMQQGPVWFLPDVVPGKGKIIINCNIPQGKAILLPLTTTICERGIENLPDDELADCADNIKTPLANMMVSVDGTTVPINGSQVKTDFFNVTFPDNPVTLFGVVKPGTYRGTATGYFLLLNDLSLGKHVIDLKVVDLLKGNEGPPPKFDPPREGSFKINVQ
jgi:hypothetical protein